VSMEGCKKETGQQGRATAVEYYVAVAISGQPSSIVEGL